MLSACTKEWGFVGSFSTFGHYTKNWKTKPLVPYKVIGSWLLPQIWKDSWEAHMSCESEDWSGTVFGGRRAHRWELEKLASDASSLVHGDVPKGGSSLRWLQCLPCLQVSPRLWNMASATACVSVHARLISLVDVLLPLEMGHPLFSEFRL